MTVQTIFRALTDQHVLTTQDRARLAPLAIEAPFLEALVAIFEHKARTYLTIGGEDAIKNAYMAFYETDKISILPTLKKTLARTSPDIESSLGLSKSGQNGDNLKEIQKKVFVSYTARYRLVKLVNEQALEALCRQANSPVFPMYLYDSLAREHALSISLRREGQNDTPQAQSERIARKFSENMPQFFVATVGIIHFVAVTAFRENQSAEFRARYFNHMVSPERLGQFTDLVGRGYLAEMCVSNRQLTNMQENKTALEQAQKFLPTLSIIEMPMAVDRTAIQNELNQIDAAVRENVAQGQQHQAELQAAQNQANQKIDEWRKSIPERPVTYGVSIGFKF